MLYCLQKMRMGGGGMERTQYAERGYLLEDFRLFHLHYELLLLFLLSIL